MGAYPCLRGRTYTGCVGTACEATSCWAGVKPKHAPALHPGQRACDHCATPFTQHGRSRYCTETCRYNAMMQRRRDRNADRRTGGRGRAKDGYMSRNQFGRFWVAPR